MQKHAGDEMADSTSFKVRKGEAALLAGVVALLAVSLFYPLVYVFKDSFFHGGKFSLAFFRSVFMNPVTVEAIGNSFVLAIVATALTALLAVPLAYAAVRFAFPFKRLLVGLLLVPMIMPPFVGAIGMRQLLSRFGSINLLLMQAGLIDSPVDWLGAARFWGVAGVMVLHLYPIMYLNVAAALANVDPTLNEAASNLGSSGWRVFGRVTLPLMMPGFFAGAVLVFIWALTDLGTPLVFQYKRVMAVQIFDRVADVTSNPEGSALVVLVLLLTVVAFVGSKRLFGSKAYQTLGKGGSRAVEARLPVPWRIAVPLLFVLVIAVSCLPHAAVILTSLRAKWFMTVLPETYTLKYYADALGHDLTLPSIRNSMTFSSLSTVVDVVVGVAVAWLLARRKFRGAELLDAAVMLPLAVPGLVLAFGYLAGFAGTRIDPRINPVPLLVMAYAVRRLPYMVRAAYAGFQQISASLEEAAANLGSAPWRVLRRITLPLTSANLVAGAILAFAFAMLEVSDSLILAMKEQFFPITKAIYQLLIRIDDGAYVASALGVWAMLFLAVSLIAAGVFTGRKMGQLFRA